MAPHPNEQQISLPSSFTSIQDLYKRGRGNLVNVIGIIKDFKPPIRTRGTERSEVLSLVTHKTTDIHLYSARQIPPPPENASNALRPEPRKATHKPGQPIHEYVSFFYHSVDKSCIPSEVEFQDIKAKYITANEKFKELKDVQIDTFVDVIVQLVRQPYDNDYRITLWVSDYTENDSFFNFAWKGPTIRADKPADPHEYESVMPYVADSGGEWKGPFGKRSMQVTCFDPHTAYVREQGLSIGSWVFLRNLHIRKGRNDANIEGFMREDLKINIAQMDTKDTVSPDPRLKEALRRKRGYEELKKIQSQEIFNASWAGKKRKSDLAEMGITSSDKPKRNKNKKKSKKKSMGHEESVTSSAVGSTISSTNDNNSNVKCEYENKPISTFEDILDPIYYKTKINSKEVELQLPFVNLNYRADVRVINFMPPDLRDFAQPKRMSEYAMLSDYEESDADSDEERGSIADRAAVRQWEWRFFLELEDANSPNDHGGKKKTLWVAVNNFSAQCLLNLDASDLHQDEDNLDILRDRLFLLWGELEEKKSIREENKRRAARAALSNTNLNRPPSHSSDDEGPAPRKHETELRSSQISNLPFSCCIRQYGVKVREEDPAKADAGKGKRWQRMFGLFGTKIVTHQQQAV
ncbi:hypothetical protein TGAMA5MH_00590 [Trichoderma gamsii]|uniref:Protection of telomeres protein 1 ssDNA-binding domain-containing protein n=1 Tax=Trichoderma gamsii TaxID=398673 RepID=A0A2K0TS13_9HYPO|nr:hypothetical protein TGAMA5MH_00590 [Trichoderma gamsii]